MKEISMNGDEHLLLIKNEIKKITSNLGINLISYSRLFGYKGNGVTAKWMNGTMKMPDAVLEWTMKMNKIIEENPPPQKDR